MSYVQACEVLQRVDPNSRLVIGQNFRSVGEILRWVNGRFGGLLSHPSQPGFEELFTVVEAEPGRMAVATLPVTVAGEGSAADIRDAEADAVAELCERIIGALTVRGREGERACRPDDIALLAPGGAELWRYERALEERGVSVSTQAGKGFYRRQEVQDLIALTRVLADGRDTLALGALLRGPLVGLTEEQLLDATDRLPEAATGGRLSLWTPITDVDDALLRTTLEILQVLAKRARSTTPFILLCQAVEELQVRAILRQRRDRTAERALSNVDLFLEQARAFDVRGLKAFASAMRTQWEEAQRALEGRPDTEQQSVSLVTMHSSKGLEWPVVIPVNTGSRVMSSVDSALDRASALLHMPVFGHYPPGTREALDAEREALERERHRIWYVAATRARDVLLLPHLSCEIPKSSWMAAFPLDHDSLPAFLAEGLGPSRLHRTEERANNQDRALFETEAALIATRTRRLQRLTPHLAEADELVERSQGVLAAADGVDGPTSPPRGSLARGLIPHKLLEEVLTGETPDDPVALEQRAVLLAAQLDGTPGAIRFDAAEAARSARRGLDVPQVREVRAALLPEVWVACSLQVETTQVVTSGIADAVAIEPGGEVSLVVDWKSDVAPTPATIAGYRGQVRAYLTATRAARGLVVFLTTGMVETIDA